MDAMRIQKESQVYSAQEKRELAIASLSERTLKENKIMADFRQLVSDKINKKS
jgi:hypothetical protein